MTSSCISHTDCRWWAGMCAPQATITSKEQSRASSSSQPRQSCWQAKTQTSRCCWKSQRLARSSLLLHLDLIQHLPPKTQPPKRSHHNASPKTWSRQWPIPYYRSTPAHKTNLHNLPRHLLSSKSLHCPSQRRRRIPPPRSLPQSAGRARQPRRIRYYKRGICGGH